MIKCKWQIEGGLKAESQGQLLRIYLHSNLGGMGTGEEKKIKKERAHSCHPKNRPPICHPRFACHLLQAHLYFINCH